MSALAIVPDGDAIVLAADGAAYDKVTGRVAGSGTKMQFLPHLGAIVAAVGQGHLIHIVPHLIGMRFSGFDDLRRDFVDLCQQSVEIQRNCGAWRDDCRATVILAGWSKKRQAFQIFKLHTLQKYECAAWQLHPIDGVWASTAPPPEHMAALGLDAEADSALDIAAKLVCANRLDSGPGRDGEEAYGVGCFLQMAILKRDGMSSFIAHRWPDRPGRVIKPAAGSMPRFPVAMP
ncbi:MAG: hypothetical protein VYD64_06160 [Pseudomonadota bacterium]|nr:hypothetical protein [Pseudomonadota bacterium]